MLYRDLCSKTLVQHGAALLLPNQSEESKLLAGDDSEICRTPLANIWLLAASSQDRDLRTAKGYHSCSNTYVGGWCLRPHVHLCKFDTKAVEY